MPGVLSQPSSTGRIGIIDPLRGIAAMAVAWFHFTNGSPLLSKDSWIRASGSYGWLGVDVFFAISGFVIPYSMYRGGYRLRPDLAVFLAKRVVRLDPPYFAAIVLTIALWYLSTLAPNFAGQAPSLRVPQLLAHFGYLNAFLGYGWLNPVFWTLAIEFQFYLLVAVGFSAFAHPRRLVRILAISGLCASSWIVSDGAYIFHFGGLFALGIAAFQYRAGFDGKLCFIVFAVCLAGVSSATLGWDAAVAGLATALIAAFVNMNPPRWLAGLGAISYSLYLVHVPIGGRVLNLGARYAQSEAAQGLVLLLGVAVSIFSAYVMYLCVERPSQRWSSAIKYRRPNGKVCSL